jgi:hypothetical protein
MLLFAEVEAMGSIVSWSIVLGWLRGLDRIQVLVRSTPRLIKTKKISLLTIRRVKRKLGSLPKAS